MKALIEILKKETETLKVQYLKMTEEWALNFYKVCEERKTWNEAKWCEFYGLTPEMKNPNTSMQWLGFPKGFYNSRQARVFDRDKNSIRQVTGLGVEKYTQKEIKLAQLHYENSILKLADRIEKKNLNQDNLSVVTSHIGVNINTTLTDGVKSVKAFTIIASGAIQRPHYRYLIK